MLHFKLRSLLACACSIAFGVAFISVAEAANWYVDAAAGGSHDGHTPATAWSTLAQINQAGLAAGDIVWIQSGTYDERLNVTKAGAPGARITYIGTGPTKPILRGVFTLDAFNNIALINLEITHGSPAYQFNAIDIVRASGWLVEDCYIHDVTQSGVNFHTYVDTTTNGNFIIRHNTFNNIGKVPGTGTWIGAVVLNIAGDHNLIEYNTIGVGDDRMRVLGSGNIIRNNRFTHTSELEFPDTGYFPVAFTAVSGKWDPTTGTYTPILPLPTTSLISLTASVYVNGGDPHSFVARVKAADLLLGTVSLDLTNYVGTIPPAGTGNMSISIRPGTHIDDLQSFDGPPVTVGLLFERNFGQDNDSANSHGWLVQDQTINTSNPNRWVISRGNIQVRVGSGLQVWRNRPQGYTYNNTWNQPMLRATTTFNPEFQWETQNGADSPNHVWINNSLNNTGQYSKTDALGGHHTNLVADYNHVFGGNMYGIGTHNVTTDPQFHAAASDDYTLNPTSPLRGRAYPMSHAANGGTNSTSLKVADALPFSDGWGIAEGDWISLANSAYVQISKIDYTTNTITLANPLSWSSGANVFVKGSEDIGALPFNFATTFTITNTSPTVVAGQNILSASVDNPDSVREVEFLVDGLPVGFALVPPYTLTYNSPDGNAHTVTVRAYSQWATPKNVAAAIGNGAKATAGGGGSGTAPYNAKVNIVVH